MVIPDWMQKSELVADFRTGSPSFDGRRLCSAHSNVIFGIRQILDSTFELEHWNRQHSGFGMEGVPMARVGVCLA